MKAVMCERCVSSCIVCLFIFFVQGLIPNCSVTHNAVKAVEGGVEVRLPAQAIQLDTHLRQEYSQED